MLPAVFLAGAIGTAVFGGKKFMDASDNNELAEYYRQEAIDYYNDSKSKMEQQREQTNNTLEELGKARVIAWGGEMKHFLDIYKKFNFDKKELSDIGNSYSIDLSDIINQDNPIESFEDMQKLSLSAKEMLQQGFGSLAAGTLSGIAAYGGVGALATASTGTAIGTLSGAAATNATLAWLGGGSLATGGLGIAGGTAVLGGVVIGPLLAVAGIFSASKSEKRLAEAKAWAEDVVQKAEQINIITSNLNKIEKICTNYISSIEKQVGHFKQVNSVLENIYASACEKANEGLWAKILNFFGWKVKVKPANLSEEDKNRIKVAWIEAQIFQQILTQNIMDEQGSPDDDAEKVLEAGEDKLGVLFANNLNNVFY